MQTHGSAAKYHARERQVGRTHLHQLHCQAGGFPLQTMSNQRPGRTGAKTGRALGRRESHILLAHGTFKRLLYNL